MFSFYEVIADPATAPLPKGQTETESAIRQLVSWATTDNFTAVVAYIERLPWLNQVWAMHDITVKNYPHFIAHPAFVRWTQKPGIYRLIEDPGTIALLNKLSGYEPPNRVRKTTTDSPWTSWRRKRAPLV